VGRKLTSPKHSRINKTFLGKSMDGKDADLSELCRLPNLELIWHSNLRFSDPLLQIMAANSLNL